MASDSVKTGDTLRQRESQNSDYREREREGQKSGDNEKTKGKKQISISFLMRSYQLSILI